MMLVRGPYVEDDRGLRIETLDLELSEIGFDPEGEAIDPRRQRGARGQELTDAAVLIRNRPADLPPPLVLSDLQDDGHAARRLSPRGVQDVRGDAAHARSFSSRRLVIF